MLWIMARVWPNRFTMEKMGCYLQTSTQLAEQLEELFQDFPVRAPLLERLRASVLAANHYRWTDAWNEHARPLFRTP